MKSRFYFYAVFFAVFGLVFFGFFITDKGPSSLAQLTRVDYPVVIETREELRGSRSQSLTLRVEGEKYYTLKDWAPSYQSLIRSIKDGIEVISLWSDKNGTIYQIELSDGGSLVFDVAVSGDGDNNTKVAWVWLVIGAVGVFWSIRQAKKV